jgi:hypothetical protein
MDHFNTLSTAEFWVLIAIATIIVFNIIGVIGSTIQAISINANEAYVRGICHLMYQGEIDKLKSEIDELKTK